MPESRRPSGKTLVRDAARAVASCPAINARVAARRLTRFLDAELREAGLSAAQFGLMAHIAAAGDDTVGALAARMGLDQSTLSRNLRGLERDGLVEILIAEDDLRRRAVWLTETGARRLEAAMPLWQAAQRAMKKHIDAAEARRLAAGAAELV